MTKSLKGRYFSSTQDETVPYANHYYHKYIKLWLDHHCEIEKKLGFFAHLGHGDVDREVFPIPACLLDSLIRSVRSSYFDYTGQLGNSVVREVIANYENHIQGIKRYSEKNIAMVLSATGGFSSAIQVLMEHYKYKGNGIIVQPTYPVYESVMWNKFGIKKVCGTRENNFLITAAEIENTLDKNTRFIILTNPTFPFGKALSSVELRKLVQITNKYKIYLILDEIFYDIPYKKIANIGSVPLKQDFIIRIKAFSKDRAVPGIRVGYIIASESLMSAFSTLADRLYTCPPTVFDAFVLKDIILRTLMKKGPDISSQTKRNYSKEMSLLGNYKGDLTDYSKHINGTLAAYQRNIELVTSLIKGNKYMDYVVPDAGINIGIGIKHTGKPYKFFENLYFKKGVIIAPGEVFDMPEYSTKWYRLTFTIDPKKLETGIKKLLDYIFEINSSS
jgi:aspartate/methionine/tyrosine aminotransferase